MESPRTDSVGMYRGVVADIMSLAYRVEEHRNLTDATWSLYALLLCTYGCPCRCSLIPLHLHSGFLICIFTVFSSSILQSSSARYPRFRNFSRHWIGSGASSGHFGQRSAAARSWHTAQDPLGNKSHILKQPRQTRCPCRWSCTQKPFQNTPAQAPLEILLNTTEKRQTMVTLI